MKKQAIIDELVGALKDIADRLTSFSGKDVQDSTILNIINKALEKAKGEGE